MYDEGRAVAEAAALLKSDFEKKEELTEEQVGDCPRGTLLEVLGV